MSLINKMLQELDRRNAMGSTSGPVPPQQVRAVLAPGTGREWFWRIIAVLALAAFGWVGWVVVQLRPQTLATDLALNAGVDAQRKAAMPEKKTAPPVQAAPELVQQASAATPAPRAEAQPSPAQAAPPPELFKLALSIDRPISERIAKPSAKSPAVQKPVAADSGASRVNKRELPRSSVDEAETLFRHGVVVLNQGRISEAQADFAAALAKHPGHEAARQALIAVLIERRDLNEAQRLLEEGLVLNPAQTQFTAVLARVLVERGDYREAAGVLAATPNTGAADSDYQLLHGAVLQRLGRHAEAVEAFQRAAKISNQGGAIWVAMGISLEATGRKAEALEAYRLSLGAGATTQDVRAYAEGRIRALN